ncbi:hypothetical protein Unana1_02434 [Umbelopsis nana]
MDFTKNSPEYLPKEPQNRFEAAALSLLLQPMTFNSDFTQEPDLWMDVPDLEIPEIDSFLPEFSEDEEEDYYQYMADQDECCICALLEPGVFCLTHSSPATDFHLDVVPIEAYECEDPLLVDRPFAADDDVNLSFLTNFDLLEF